MNRNVNVMGREYYLGDLQTLSERVNSSESDESSVVPIVTRRISDDFVAFIYFTLVHVYGVSYLSEIF